MELEANKWKLCFPDSGREILPLLLTQPSVWVSSSGPSKRVDEEGSCGLCGQSSQLQAVPKAVIFQVRFWKDHKPEMQERSLPETRSQHRAL